MPSKLSRYSEGIMEAAWLAAVILVPVFFNVYSSRIFEPDKITLLRTLALVVLAAWVIRSFEGGRVQWGSFQSDGSPVKNFLRYPLMAPVLFLTLAYLIATAFSVSPAVSLWGSYQRLQGTYTTFSYLVIFTAIVANLRRRVQVERIITTIIIASIPVTLYGVLQRYGLDPIPWGGDVSTRIAANMGNSIFVAAYLIMVFPLTVGRIIQSFRAILSEGEDLWSHVARATIYVFAGALQLIAIYMSGSRGPVMGLVASAVFLGLILTIHWRKRWLALVMVGAAVLVGAFLVVFNIENGPLEGLRESPAIGRFGNLLNPESNSALVRKYIWEGAAELVAPHDPLEFPDGSKDRLNFLRPLIGYGPESMYVAYNPFYPPALGHVEKRNASPDRSHNETWDSLVITGALGFLAYLAIFTSVFYYGLRWLGLVEDRKKKTLFFGLYFGFGILGAAGLAYWGGVEFIGVGLPFGLVLGLMAYLAYAAIFPPTALQKEMGAGERIRSLTMIMLLAAIVAHFVEINFGIAIAVTRTYFWVFSGLLLAAGYILPLFGQYGDAPIPEAEERKAVVNVAEKSARKKRRGRSRRVGQETVWPDWLRGAVICGITVGIILVTLGFDYISNVQGGKTALQIVLISFSRIGRGSETSYGILALILTTWITTSIVLSSERREAKDLGVWAKMLGVTLGVSAVLALVFWLWHAADLANLANAQASTMDQVLDQVRRYEGHLTKFYTYIFLLIFGQAFFLVPGWPQETARSPWVAWMAAPALLILVIYLSAVTNLRVIQADVAFKMAEPFAKPGQWPVAINIYNHANDLAPNEDYYYLFLGRAYLEQARTIEDAETRDQVVSEAESELLEAQQINPLNTDHTANLARLYSLWASFSDDQEKKAERASISDQYFEKAVTLSPNNSRLWDEWALLYMNIIGDPEGAKDRLETAMGLDPTYDWTLGLMGDYYVRGLQGQESPEQKDETLKKAAQLYEEAIDNVKYYERQNLFNYIYALGGVYVQLDQPEKAIQVYEDGLMRNPTNNDRWRLEESLARLYAQRGNMAVALRHAQNALSVAPDNQKDRLEQLVAQIDGQQ